MQHLEGSGTPVLYIGRRFLKVNLSLGNMKFIKLNSNTYKYLPHHGATAPSGPGTSRIHTHTQLDTPHWTGHLSTNDQADAVTST